MDCHQIENKLIIALEHDNTLTLADLGGIDSLYCNLSNITYSRFLPEFISILLTEIDELKKEDKKKAEVLIIYALENCNDEFNIQAILKMFEYKLESQPKLCDSIYPVFITQSKNTENKSFNRGCFLESAFRIALKDKRKRFELLSHLIDVAVNDCNEYLKYSSKIIGLSYSIWQENELFEKLEEIKQVGKGDDEVWFELGMCHLLKALNSQTQESAISSFIKAKKHFKKSIVFGSERSDAEAYYTIITILLSVNDPDFEKNLNTSIKKLNKAVTIHSSWHSSEEDNLWMTARNTEIMNWFILINKLEKLFKCFSEPCWYEPIVVIESYLLNIFTASRTILLRDELGGLEKIFQPKIKDKLMKKPSQLYQLDQWLKLQKNSDLGEIGNNLKREIESNKLQLFQDLEELIPSFKELSPNKLTDFHRFILNYRCQQTNDVKICVERIFNNCTKILTTIEDYKIEKVKLFFQNILYLSIKFLDSRMDGTKAHHDNLAYLFETLIKPHENELQEDYFGFMSGAFIDGTISVEKSDVASGRVDVNFSSNNFNITSEIKRDWQDCSFDAIRTKYLGQASEYSNTDVKLGFLFVLDLMPKPTGVRSIESCVKVEIVEKKNDPYKRGIVVFVVPGMRKTPSQIKLEQS